MARSGRKKTALLPVATLTKPFSLQEAAEEFPMRWFLTGVTALVFALVGGGVVQACGCGCCASGCKSCASGNCANPNCPNATGSCPNCPQHAASYGASRYWNTSYGCYLYYDPSTRLSYYWSEPHHSYYPVQDSFPDAMVPPGVEAPPLSPAS